VNKDALLKKLAKAKARPPKAKAPAVKKAKKLKADVLGANPKATVGKVNRRGTAKAKRKSIPGKPRTRRSLAPTFKAPKKGLETKSLSSTKYAYQLP